MPTQSISTNRLGERIRAAVRHTIRASGVTRLVVACSGGPDSVCLAHATAHVVQEQGWTLAIAHIRHGLRPDDAADAALVRDLANDLSVPFLLTDLAAERAEAPERNIEGLLRDARYRALDAAVAARSAEAVLTGHTLDDQAETVLQHLLRGAGMDGLAGMTAIGLLPLPMATQARTLLRPLLTIRREETHAYCTAHGLPTVHDATNDDDAFNRNWLRHHILPLIEERYPGAAPVLARTATLLHDDADYLRSQTETACDYCVRLREHDVVVFDAERVRTMHPALFRRVLRTLFGTYSDELGRLETIDRLRSAAASQSSALIHIGPLASCRAYDAVIIGAPAAVIDQVRAMAARLHPLLRDAASLVEGELCILPSEARIPRYSLTIYPAADVPKCLPLQAIRWLRIASPAPWSVRTRREGDHLTLAGKGRRVALRRYFMEQDIPVPVRDAVPLLVVGDAICWVVGYDTAAQFAADPANATHAAVLTMTDPVTRERPNEDAER
jgi:tRNA(Ile)-lysidine synthetase-like protein